MIIGKNIDLRKVEVTDAEFILKLRLDPNLNQYISETKDDIQGQRQWITSHNTHSKDYYFIIQNKEDKPVGTVRIYDIKDDRFCWGSWIVIPEARKYATLESITLIYEYAFFNLNLNYTVFDVRKKNDKALNFYLRYGASIIDQNEIDYFLTFKREQFIKKRDEYLKIIDKIVV